MVFLKIICTHFIFSIILQTDHKPDGVQVEAYLKEITPSDFHQLQQSHKLIDLCCYGSTPGKEGLKTKQKNTTIVLDWYGMKLIQQMKILCDLY